MKVIVLTSIYPRRNAMMKGYFIHQQVKALRQLGVECHVFLTHNWYPKFGLHKLHPYWRVGFNLRSAFFDDLDGVKIHHIPVLLKMPSRWFREDPYVREANAIAKYIKDTPGLQNCDWLYAQFLTDAGYIGSLVKQRTGIRLAAIARGDDVHDWPSMDKRLRSTLNFVYKTADILLANSSRLGHDAEIWNTEKLPLNFRTVYNGVNYLRFKPVASENDKNLLRNKFALPKSRQLILSVGAPIILKGFLDLLDASKRAFAYYNNWQLVIILPVSRYAGALDLELEAFERGIKDFVIVRDAVHPDDMPDLYRAMDAFVLASHNEGLSNAVLEAMSSGLPVVATNVGGHSEVIDDGISGLLVPPKDVQNLSQALIRIMGQDKERSEFGKSARSRMETFGTYEQNAAKLKLLLESEAEVF